MFTALGKSLHITCTHWIFTCWSIIIIFYMTALKHEVEHMCEIEGKWCTVFLMFFTRLNMQNASTNISAFNLLSQYIMETPLMETKILNNFWSLKLRKIEWRVYAMVLYSLNILLHFCCELHVVLFLGFVGMDLDCVKDLICELDFSNCLDFKVF